MESWVEKILWILDGNIFMILQLIKTGRILIVDVMLFYHVIYLPLYINIDMIKTDHQPMRRV